MNLSTKGIFFLYAAAALRCQHLATVHCLQGDTATAASLLQKASEIIETIQDKKLRLFNIFLTGANSALQGKLHDAMQALKIDPKLLEKSNVMLLLVTIFLAYLFLMKIVHRYTRIHLQPKLRHAGV